MAIEAAARTVVLLDPTTGADSREIIMPARPGSLDGLVLGLLDNGKLNAGKLLGMVAEELRREHKLAGVIAVRKPNASQPAPDEVYEELASKANVVISGIGD